MSSDDDDGGGTVSRLTSPRFAGCEIEVIIHVTKSPSNDDNDDENSSTSSSDPNDIQETAKSRVVSSSARPYPAQPRLYKPKPRRQQGMSQHYTLSSIHTTHS